MNATYIKLFIERSYKFFEDLHCNSDLWASELQVLMSMGQEILRVQETLQNEKVQVIGHHVTRVFYTCQELNLIQSRVLA